MLFNSNNRNKLITDNTIDDIDEEPVSEQQQEITGKEGKHLLTRLYSFFSLTELF